MPISREEFESALERPAYLVLEFLRANMDTAYTAPEIASELARTGSVIEQSVAEGALGELTRRGWVETSMRDGEVYYAYRRWIGFRR